MHGAGSVLVQSWSAATRVHREATLVVFCQNHFTGVCHKLRDLTKIRPPERCLREHTANPTASEPAPGAE